MKFTMAIQKMQKGAVTVAFGHNCRTHPTASQLPRPAWFDPSGTYMIRQGGDEWDTAKVARAASLAKRKDAVMAIEFVVQVGNQTDWRDPPTPDCPEGRPRPLPPTFKKDLLCSMQAWVEATFGKENVIGLHLHLDESTPHVHAVVTPIKDNKLQAKHWLDGGWRIAELRKSCHAVVAAKIPCEYTPNSGVGGKPHDPSQAAGQGDVPTLLDKMTGRKKVRELEREIEQLRGENEQLKQTLFSRQKARFSAAAVEAAEGLKTENDELRGKNDKLASAGIAAMAQIETLRQQLADAKAEHLREKAEQEQAWQEKIAPIVAEVAELRGKNARLADQNNELIDSLREYKRDQRHP